MNSTAKQKRRLVIDLPDTVHELSPETSRALGACVRQAMDQMLTQPHQRRAALHVSIALERLAVGGAVYCYVRGTPQGFRPRFAQGAKGGGGS